MPVFKNGQNDYQLDFSNRLSSRLNALYKNDSDKFNDLSKHLKNKFSWLFGMTADFPVLKIGFATQEDADKADKQLHNEISEWFKQVTKLTEEVPAETTEPTASKWILITAVNNDIYADEFDTYDRALDSMKQEYDTTVEAWDDAYFTSDYASIQTTCDQFDWKIIRVDF